MRDKRKCTGVEVECCSAAAAPGVGLRSAFPPVSVRDLPDCPHPLSVEVIKSFSILTLCCASLYTLEVFNGDKYRSVCFRMKWPKQKVIFDRVKITEGVFAISGLYYVAVIQVVG